MSLNEKLQDVKGQIALRLHEMRGVELTYTLFTDLTTDPPTKVVLNNVPVRPTPSGWGRRTEFGVFTEEITDVFTVSREAIQSPAGTFRRPTTRDHFTVVGDAAALRYKVREVQEPDEYESVYELHCYAERSKFVRDPT